MSLGVLESGPGKGRQGSGELRRRGRKLLEPMHLCTVSPWAAKARSPGEPREAQEGTPHAATQMESKLGEPWSSVPANCFADQS